MSYETRYAALKRHQNTRDTPESRAARERLREAMQKADADVKERYGNPIIFTQENIEAVFTYQQERQDFWRSEMGC